LKNYKSPLLTLYFLCLLLVLKLVAIDVVEDLVKYLLDPIPFVDKAEVDVGTRIKLLTIKHFLDLVAFVVVGENVVKTLEALFVLMNFLVIKLLLDLDTLVVAVDGGRSKTNKKQLINQRMDPDVVVVEVVGTRIKKAQILKFKK
jgi:hypothetical protein